ncbi:MAG: phosphatidate cytidylyltransferase [Verrucomicrobia bacterium]|nr:phosphatidate cytidylyltransferase [Verrucomicrobiota bacterium]
MKDRALSTIGLWVIVGLVIWVGGFFSVAEQASFGLLALIICAAQYEFYQLVRAIPGVSRPNVSGIVAGFALHFGLFFLAAEEARANYLLTGGALLVGLHLLSLLRHPGEVPTLLRRFPTLYGFAYLPFMLASLIAIARMKDGHLLTAKSVGLYYVVWVFVATKFTDVGGLLIGVPFGKHKIAPTISPAKSWEGCLGGLAASAGASALFAWLLRDAFGVAFMVPWKAAVLALPIAVLSIPSDLIESVFKRLAGAKDSGATIPGIGGALDLIDSMVLTSPAALILLSYCLDWAKRAG